MNKGDQVTCVDQGQWGQEIQNGRRRRVHSAPLSNLPIPSIPSTMPTRILISSPAMYDNTSFWRGVGPVSRLCATHDHQLTMARDVELYDWPYLRNCDVLFLQRPNSARHLSLAAMAINMSIPVWIDYDDDIFSIPSDNPNNAYYAGNEVRACIRQLEEIATAFTVSTPELQKVFTRADVIPNAYPDYLFRYAAGPHPLDALRQVREPAKRDNESLEGQLTTYLEPDGVDAIKKPEIKIMWRGSVTHVRDLYSVSDEIMQFSRARNGVHQRWTFLGFRPWFLDDLSSTSGVTATEVGAFNIPIYFRKIWEWRPDIMIVPLHKCQFNHAKSNIAYLESMHAGAVCIAPDWPQWRLPGAVNYCPGRAKDFRAALEHVASLSPEDRREMVDAGRQHIHQNMLEDQANKLRHKLLCRLIGKVEVANPCELGFGQIGGPGLPHELPREA
jgi:hypothetical protein